MAINKTPHTGFLRSTKTPGYSLGHVLGSGCSATVISATRLSDNVKVAAKCIYVGEDSHNAVQDVLREAQILAECQHPNVVRLLEVVHEDTRTTLVLEQADSGDLTAVMRNGRGMPGCLNEDTILFGFVQVALALYHVHGRGFLHGDVKPQNIVVHNGKFMKLCDFGAATSSQSSTACQPGVGTAPYLAPEIWQGQQYTEKSDVWALGCVLYEMVSGSQPYSDSSMFKVMRKILAADRKPLPKECSPQLRALVNSMLQHDPKLRPTMQQILTTPFVYTHLQTYVSVTEHELGTSASLGLEGLHEEYLKSCQVGTPAAAHGAGNGPAATAAAAGSSISRIRRCSGSASASSSICRMRRCSGPVL